MTELKNLVLVVGATIVYDYIFCVDRLPEPGRTARILPQADQLQGQRFPGGSAFNIALGLAKLNERARLTHPVGRDFAGSDYEQTLAEVGVLLDGLLINNQRPSGVAYVFGAADGSTMCFTSLTELTDAQISAAALKDIDLVVLTPLSGPLHQQAHTFAQNEGIPLASCGIAEPELLTWLPQMAMLSINEYEMGLLSKIEGGLNPATLSQRMAGYLFITQGAEGCSVYHKGQQLAHIGAVPPRRVVDTTGAGDAFFAATLAAMRKGLDPVDAARIGVLSGSMVVEALGCQTNLPDWPAIVERARRLSPGLVPQIEKVRLI